MSILYKRERKIYKCLIEIELRTKFIGHPTILLDDPKGRHLGKPLLVNNFKMKMGVNSPCLIWFGLVWFGMVWDNIPSEASVKVSSRSNLFWLFQRRFSVCFLWLGLVWLSLLRFGSREHSSEASVKVSSRLVLAFLQKIQCWFCLVRLCMDKFGLRQHPSEASVNVSSESDYFWLF